MDNSIYSDIAKRTGGNIYIGVVGPVRSGKSTFISRFMNNLVCLISPTSLPADAPTTSCRNPPPEKR